MRGIVKLVLLWLVLSGGLYLSMLLPHGHADSMGLVNASLQLLLCILSFVIASRSHGRYKYVYLNLGLFFGYVIFLIMSLFVGNSFSTHNAYSAFYYRFYVNRFGLSTMNLFVFSYLLIDYLLPRHRTVVKYGTSTLVSLLFVIPLFYSFLFHPLRILQQEDYVGLLRLKKVEQKLKVQYGREPSQFELSAEFADTVAASPEAAFSSSLSSVRRLIPYLKDGAEITIAWKPINLKAAFVTSASVMLMVFFLFSSYKFNLPYSAYLDKIVFLVLIFSITDAFHYLAYNSSQSLEHYYSIFQIGQYVTVFCLILLVMVFALRLRFVSSPTGQYYERMLEKSSGRVTRWRDEIDNFILRVFSRRIDDIKNIGHLDDNNKPSKRSTL